MSQYGGDGSAHSPLVEGDKEGKEQNWEVWRVAGVLGFRPPSSILVRWRKNELAQKEAELRRTGESTEPANRGEGRRGGMRSLGPRRLDILDDGRAGSEEWVAMCSPLSSPGGLFALGPVY